MRIAFAAIACVACCALSAPAYAGEGWYIGLGAGWEKLNNFDYSSPGVSEKVDPSGNFIGTGAIGYKMGPWRFELEGDGSHTKYLGDAGGTIWAGAAANAYYDIPVAQRLNFYLGGGVGMAAVNREGYQPLLAAGEFAHWGFQWQGIAGLTYALDRHIDLYGEYRYRGLQTSHVDEIYPGSGPINANDLRQNAFMVGVRWYPWAAEPPPPPPPPAEAAPPPPPPPPPPAPTKTFIVFFDFNKSNLTSEALTVVQEAVKTMKETGSVRVLVTGHTDTVGSDSYNQGLSVRRAESVKDEMVREGVEGSEIAIEGKSFHDPLVPTGPGVREPQNRRAVINLNG